MSYLSVLGRYPFNSPWVRAWTDRWFLKLWFGVFALHKIVSLWETPGSFGYDVRLYHRAAEAWIAGGDPWSVRLLWSPELGAFGYAGPPQTLLPFLLVAWVPEDVLVLAFMLTAGATAMWVLRRLGLPVWWMAFPPLIEGIWVGNLNIFVIALLVSGGIAAGVLATTLKAYAALPLIILGSWRPIVVAGVLAVITIPFLPWEQFLAQYQEIAATLAEQAWGGRQSIRTNPVAIAILALALVVLGRERAAWLAVPVLWPATQFHYLVLALPAMTPWLALFAAVPEPGAIGLGVVVLALHRLTVSRRARGAAA